jgi:hypothetical protein
MRFRQIAAWFLILSFAATAAGCTAWKKKGIDSDAVRQLPDPPNPKREFRLTLFDKTRLLLRNPRIVGDTISGTPGYPSRDHYKTYWSKADTMMALADIRVIEVRQVDALRTTLLVVGVGAAVGLVVAAIVMSSDNFGLGGGSSSSSSGGGDYYGSCPLIHSWNGHEWVLDSGTFGGAFLKPLEYTDVDDLEALAQQDGLLRLRLEAGVGETDHIDDLTILAVDHDPSVRIAASPEGVLHTIGAPVVPLHAWDDARRDALPLVMGPDGRAWQSLLAERDTSSAEDCRDNLYLEFPKPVSPRGARLVVKAQKTVWATYLMRTFVSAQGTEITKWYDAMESNPAAGAAFKKKVEDEVDLEVSVWRGGRWVRETAVWGGGPEIAKTFALPLDLTGVEGPTVRVRLQSVPSFWLVDWAALDSSPERPVVVHELRFESALARDGRDVNALLAARDGKMLVIENGERVHLTIVATAPPAGVTRTYLSRTRGWYRFHAPETAPVDPGLVQAVLRRPGGISREAVAQANRALRSSRGKLY